MIPTYEQRALQEAARRYAREQLLPLYQKREREARMDGALRREMGQLGFIGMDVSAEFGGMGCSAVTTGLVVEELSYGDFNVGSFIVLQSLCGALLDRNGQEALKRQWLPRVCQASRERLRD